MLRVTSLFVLAAAASLACRIPLWNPHALPRLPGLSHGAGSPDDTTDYGVLRWTVDWLAHHYDRDAPVLFVRDSTRAFGMSLFNYLLAVDTAAVDSWLLGKLARHSKLANVDIALIRDFRDRNRNAIALVAESISLAIPVVLVGDSVDDRDWSPLDERHPMTSHVVFVLSRGGFNADRTRVLLSYSARCRAQSCGRAGYILLACAPGRRWTLWHHWVPFFW